MRKVHSILLFSAAFLLLSGNAFSQKFIADHTIANERVLRSIPAEYINKARTEFVVAYQHTSHGTHVAKGVFGLQDYKDGDDLLFGVTIDKVDGLLDFRDNVLASYAPEGVNGQDLSTEETAFIQTTRNFLDAPENADVNVIMWSWCNISGHDAAGTYLPGMADLISEYGVGGSKIGTGTGLREKPVHFIFMTGHANVNGNVGIPLRPKEQAATINNYCIANQQFSLDYYAIDTHDMDGDYWEDAGDNGNSEAYGGNFYEDWQDAHVEGEDYFSNKDEPGGSRTYGSHLSQHITSNRKGYAFWWILSRMAGWDGTIASLGQTEVNNLGIYPNPTNGKFRLTRNHKNIDGVQVFGIHGNLVLSDVEFSAGEESISIDLSDQAPGIYCLKLLVGKDVIDHGKLIIAN